MTIRHAMAALVALVATAAAATEPTEQQGSYREAVLCSGLLGASAAYLEAQDKNCGSSSSAGDIQTLQQVQKRWVSRAISLAPDTGQVMGDVGAKSKFYAQLYDQLEHATETELEAKLGPDMSRCLSGASELPE